MLNQWCEWRPNSVPVCDHNWIAIVIKTWLTRSGRNGGNGWQHFHSTYHLVIESDAVLSQLVAINRHLYKTLFYAIVSGIASDVFGIDGIFESNLWSLFVIRARNSLIPTFVWIVWLGQYVYIMSFTLDTLYDYITYTAHIYCIWHSLLNTLNAKLIHYCRQIAPHIHTTLQQHQTYGYGYGMGYGCGTSVALYILYVQYIA